MRAPTRPAVALAIGALALAGCGGGDDEDDGLRSATTATAEPATSATEPEEAAGGGEPTGAGAELDFGEAATVDYSVSGAGGDEVRVEVAPLRVEEGDPSDIEDLDVSDAPDDAVPHYLTVRVKNVDDREISQANPATFVDAYDDQGEEQEEITILLGEFEPCSDEAPEPIEPGAEYETCLLYLLPPGESIERVQWIILGGDGGDPIVWER